MQAPQRLAPSRLFTKRAFASVRDALARTERLQALLRELQDNVGLEGRSREEIRLLSASHPEAFARRYMIKNMVKCAIATEFFKSDIRAIRRVIDLGCGPGTFLIPFASMMRNTEFVGIDRSRAALHLCHRLFGLTSLPQPLLIHGLVPGSIASGGRFFTASYLLAEFEPDQLAAFARWVGHRTDAGFLVVDYIDVVLKTAQYLTPYRACDIKKFEFQLPADIAGAVDDRQISFGALFAPAGGLRDAQAFR
jgi:hypothetical protein